MYLCTEAQEPFRYFFLQLHRTSSQRVLLVPVKGGPLDILLGDTPVPGRFCGPISYLTGGPVAGQADPHTVISIRIDEGVTVGVDARTLLMLAVLSPALKILDGIGTVFAAAESA